MTSPFAGRSVHSYADGPPRQVPGFHGLHRMARMLLAERVPANGRILVLGAGGGLELKAFAEAQPGWSFDGVDPSADMLRLAREMTAPHADRIRLLEGYIGDAPEGPFDGATAILTFHFIERAQRLEALRQLHRRLRPGAPLVLAHISFAQTEPERSMWIARHVAPGHRMEPTRRSCRLRARRSAPAFRSSRPRTRKPCCARLGFRVSACSMPD